MMGTPDDHDHDRDLDLELPADLDVMAGARRAVRAWLTEQAVDGDAAVDLLTVASEFLLHAIVRAGGQGSVRLVGHVHVNGIRLSVRAERPAVRVLPVGLPGDPLADGALGRRVVEACCGELHIAPAGASTFAECWRPSA